MITADRDFVHLAFHAPDLLAPGCSRGPEGSINELAIERSAARVPDIAS